MLQVDNQYVSLCIRFFRENPLPILLISFYYTQILSVNGYLFSGIGVLIILSGLMKGLLASLFLQAFASKVNAFCLVLLSALIVISIEFPYDFPVEKIGVFSVVTVCAALFALFKIIRHKPDLFIIFLSLMILSNLYTNYKALAAPEMEVIEVGKSRNIISGQPELIVHIILDGLGSIDTLGLDPSNAQILKEFQDIGFNLSPSVYTNDINTNLSMPAMFNYSDTGQEYVYDAFSVPPINTLKANLLFEDLKGVGFNIQAVGAYIDWCSGSITANKCYDYQKHRIFDDDLPRLQNLYLFFRHVAQISRAEMVMRHISPLPQYQVDRNISVSLTAANNLKKLIQHSSGRQYYLAHLIFPHPPYIYNAKCEKVDYAWMQSDELRIDRYRDQSMCALKVAMEMVKVALAKDPGAKIIINSDHGPHNFEMKLSNGRQFENSIFFLSNTASTQDEILVGSMLKEVVRAVKLDNGKLDNGKLN